MNDDVPNESQDSGVSRKQEPESYLWPLVALVLLILPQVLVPARRVKGHRCWYPSLRQWFQAKAYPDFQFPQTLTEGLGPPGWQPRFQDHLYLAFTNVVAFSPIGTMPLTHRVKGLMAIQSLISLSVLVLVLSREINILPP